MKAPYPSWPPNLPQVREMLDRVVESGDWGRYKSPHHKELVSRLADRFDTDFVRLCGSGSAAIEISLRAAGVSTGDEVAVAAYDYTGNFRAIEAVGARPCLIDTALGNPCMDANQLSELPPEGAGKHIKAVIASHLYGVAAPISEIANICQQNGWVLIEDACQVPGMSIEGKPAGSFGDLATLSFGGSKPWTAGNGGAVLTSHAKSWSRMNAYLDRPSDSQPMSTMQCAALLPQLDLTEEFNSRRDSTATFLRCATRDSKLPWTVLSTESSSTVPAYYKFAWNCESLESRGECVASAEKLGIPLGAGFRSMSSSSARRCNKPFSLDNAARLGETTIVLDQRALLIPDESHCELLEDLCLVAG